MVRGESPTATPRPRGAAPHRRGERDHPHGCPGPRIGADTLVESEPSRPIDRLRRPERGLCDGFGVQPHLRRPGQEIRRANGRPRSSVGSGAVIWLDLHN
jgi:hypothetical protein